MKTLLARELCSYLSELDGKLYWKIKPSRKTVLGSIAGTTDDDGYRVVTFRGTKFFVHRIVYLLHQGYMPEFIDHINGNRVDNNISNLRVCTKQENSYNAKLSSRNKSGVKGVTWHSASNKWHVRLGQVYLGIYASLTEAQAVVERYRAEFHGDFARNK